ncbi:MAG: hypothetical protein CMN77_16455 [Spirochaetaceae bacterium]|nr:hypothetical protein [Spirochaetaceae bacterium]|tara:strand:- start:5973 stop:6545 length:573 start_codon:yes stop_codon:yes gene_type:complete
MDTDGFYIVNYSLAALFPVLVSLWAWLRRDFPSQEVRVVFWLGTGLGALWEFPFNAWAAFDTDAIVIYLTEPPLSWPLCALLHSFWDGALFVAGWALVTLIHGRYAFRAFFSAPMVTLLVWSQLQEILVEALSLASGAWMWNVTSWNPALFEIGSLQFTILPQIIWLVAPIIFFAYMRHWQSGGTSNVDR